MYSFSDTRLYWFSCWNNEYSTSIISWILSLSSWTINFYAIIYSRTVQITFSNDLVIELITNYLLIVSDYIFSITRKRPHVSEFRCQIGKCLDRPLLICVHAHRSKLLKVHIKISKAWSKVTYLVRAARQPGANGPLNRPITLAKLMEFH